MYLETVSIEKTLHGCNAQGEYITVIAKPSRDISDILPYLHSVTPRAAFVREPCCLSFQEGIHIYRLTGSEIRLTRLQSPAEAQALLCRLKDRINDVYSNSGGITPDYSEKKPVTTFQLYKSLPKTNCKKCGEPTCMAFAAKLIEGAALEDECPLLDEARYYVLKQSLTALLYGTK